MKGIKILIFTVLFVWMGLFCSCGFFGDQQYFCDANVVESIEIVKLGKVVEGEYRREYTVLATVEDVTVFVDRLNGLKHSVNWGEPSVMYIDYVVVKVNYTNGDYDLLHSSAQIFRRDGSNRTGYFFFDKGQFDTLLSEYWDGEEENTGDGSGNTGDSSSS